MVKMAKYGLRWIERLPWSGHYIYLVTVRAWDSNPHYFLLSFSCRFKAGSQWSFMEQNGETWLLLNNHLICCQNESTSWLGWISMPNSKKNPKKCSNIFFRLNNLLKLFPIKPSFKSNCSKEKVKKFKSALNKTYQD